MCNKVKNKIECEKCEYPYEEALYPDDYDYPLDCNCSEEIIIKHIAFIEELKSSNAIKPHYYDCLCLIHR